ncbi:MAG: Hpt domain-containing protein [Bryobacteraceae bacterium]|nr:Hpt domain-containing protein [Bryobacterales bacterium]MEB2363463.1 Hpt domain-containing protein [Bryobacterales bacterium]NUN02088.1 Hpt domain-containing protein [Bryobacteraceae bacterium]
MYTGDFARNETAVLDKAVAIDRVGGDLALLQEVAQLFLDHTPEMLAAIKKAIGDSDAAALQLAAHSLKGSVGTFGAAQAYQAALDLEVIGRNGRLGDAVDALSKLETALDELTPEIATLTALQ